MARGEIAGAQPVHQKLTAKQSLFVAEYLKDLNATQAAIRAGYAHPTTQGPRLLENVGVKRAIEQAQSDRVERTQIDADYVLRQAVKLHGRCMQEVAPFTDRKGEHIHDEAGHPLYVFNSTGAAKALELVGKHVNVQAFRDRMEHTGKDGGPIQTETTVSDDLRSVLDAIAGKISGGDQPG